MSENHDKQFTINISTGSIIRFLVILAVLGVVYLLREVILILVVAIIIASALNPWVASLQRRGIPRIVATLCIYILFFGAFIACITQT